MTVQLVARIPEETVRAVDALVADGVLTSRSEAIRTALDALVERHRREAVGAAIVAGYRQTPQTDEELASIDSATAAMIAEEPW